MYGLIRSLDVDIFNYKNVPIFNGINTYSVECVVDSYLEAVDSDYEYHGHSSSDELNISEIEAKLFER